MGEEFNKKQLSIQYGVSEKTISRDFDEIRNCFVEYIELFSDIISWIEKWKVFIPKANNIGTELNDDNLNAFISELNTICTESYICIGWDYNLDQTSSLNLVKYLKSKFVRYLHSVGKAIQDATSKTFKFVPMQDFTNTSDIDWNKSIDEIDEQLFKKYGLDEEEINYIKQNIKPMQ